MKRILFLTLLVAVLGAGAVSAARAQVQVSLDPSMTKGARDATVTIVEFSDYQ